MTKAEASRVSRRQEAPDWTFDGTLFYDMGLETFAEQASAALAVIAWEFRETNDFWLGGPTALSRCVGEDLHGATCP